MSFYQPFVFKLSGLLLSAAGIAAGQVTTATFYGVVHDPSGATVADALIRMVNEGTGIKIDRSTDVNGEFAFNFVPPGSYTFQIQKSGFKTYQQKNLELDAGQEVRQVFTVSVGAVTEQVTVVGHAPLVNTTSLEQSESLSTLKVRDLPLAERNLVAAAGLTTGVIATLGSGNNAGNLDFNGLGWSGASVTLDGTDATGNAKSNQLMMFGGFDRIAIISLEAVDGVQMTKGIVPAEYAPTMSGNINIVTKSGTNQWHGSLFENFEGRALNARVQNLTSKPPFTFNQFGGALGGPILKNKLFVFGAYEGYRRAAFQVVQGDVPTQAVRDQLLAAVPAYKLVIDAFPLPNQPVTPGALNARYVGAASQHAGDDHFVIKPDYWISDRHRLSATYTRGRPSQDTPRLSPLNSRIFSGERDRITGTYTTFGSSLTAESRFGFNRNHTNRLDAWYEVKDPSKAEVQAGDRRVPNIRATTVGLDTGGGEAFINGEPASWSVEQKVSLQIGKHALKFGGIFFDRRIGGSDFTSPTLTYTALSDLLSNRPNAVGVPLGIPPYRAAAREFGFFVQDDWRLTPRLVLNLGLRWDYFGHLVAKGKDGGPPYYYNPDGLLDASFHIGPFRPVDDPYRSDALNLGPRAGLAYNPDGHGANVFRVGAGVLFSPIVLEIFDYGVMSSPTQPSDANFTQAQAAALGLRFPLYKQDILPLVQQTGAGAAYAVVNPNLQNPYSLNLYAGYQRALSQSMMLESAFVGNHGVKFVTRRGYNWADRVTGIQPNPALGRGRYFDNSDGTHYVSWQNSLRKRYSNNLTFDVHYTWGKALAYGAGDIGDNSAGVQDFFNLRANKGPASKDVTHLVTGDFIYHLPRLKKIASPLLRHAAGGWEMTGILATRTGAAINVTQSSSIGDTSRVDATGILAILSNWRSTNQYLNPAAFQLVPVSRASGAPMRPGTLGNGAIRVPGQWNLDFGLGKNFRVTERIHLQLRADMFNSLNHTNWTSVTTNIQSAAFGQLSATAGARTMQLNGRLTF